MARTQTVEFTWHGKPFPIKKGDTVIHASSRKVLTVVLVQPEQRRIAAEDAKGRGVYYYDGSIVPDMSWLDLYDDDDDDDE